jgi:Tol biopolymer transport system component
MRLEPGVLLGLYDVRALIGVGGMGEVYSALDTRLGRLVALKVLPDSVATDPSRKARLEREARVLASLNHPNIAAVYSIEAQIPALVLELVEGPTLADRLAAGAIPVAEAVTIARQIAQALEAAHDCGIVHRDLKPSNIKVRTDGTVKVLDFGLSKALDPATSGSELNDTITAPTGVVLGTAAYMSPEQAQGQAVDKRTDIWAFGCVLYEMLTGRRAFGGSDMSQTIAAVIGSEPDWTKLPSLPPAVRVYLQRCLSKDRGQRVRDIGDVRLALDGAFDAPPIAHDAERRASKSGVKALAALAVVTSISAGAIVWTLSQRAVERRVVRGDVPAPPGTALIRGGQPLSPDGRTVAFVASRDARSMIWVRALDEPAARPLQGTDGAAGIFWSPDGRELGFFADGQMKRVSLATGSVLKICDESEGHATWNRDGIILIGGQRIRGPLMRVSAAGGTPVPVTELAIAGSWHDYPHFLPDGRHFLYVDRPRADNGSLFDLYVGVLGSQQRRLLKRSLYTSVLYSATGHVLFMQAGTLMAQRFSADRLELSGEAVAVTGADASRDQFSVSVDGTLGFFNAFEGETELEWFERSGRSLDVVGARGFYMNPELSPQGTHVAFTRDNDIFVLDTATGRVSRIETNPSADAPPVWSPDGSAIAFGSDRDGPWNIYSQPTGQVGGDRALLKNDMPKAPGDWSRDGHLLIFQSDDAGRDVWVLEEPLSAAPRSRQITNTPFSERNPRISPDARWIAYESDETGRGQRMDVYLQSFSGAMFKQQVSVNGGEVPRWSWDGRELYFIAPDSTLMAVSIEQAGSSLRIGKPFPLFRTRMIPPSAPGSGLGRNYSVDQRGRFLINVLPADLAPPSITLMFNWTSALPQ